MEIDGPPFEVIQVNVRSEEGNAPSQCEDSVCPASPTVLLDGMKQEIKLSSGLWPQLEAVAGEDFQVVQPRLSVSKIFQQ